MKTITVIAVILFVSGFLYADTETIIPKEIQARPVRIISGTDTPIQPQPSTSNRDLTQIYFEDFESGAPDWAVYDATDPGTFWHTDTYNAYGGTGRSWWMGDPEVGPNGGYLDHWYQVLDTPEIELPGTGPFILSFKQYRAIEEPGGEPPPYDGWDGFNVRIRLPGESYNDAEILENCTPAYNCSSMYSFGFEFGEGPGIPGWGGFSNGWRSFDITIPNTYQGETVIISFAFASDPAYCTTDNPALTGVFIDNIDVAGVYYNDGEDETGWYGFSNTIIGGQLWHIFEDASAPSPTHAAGCFDPATGTYNPYMEDFYESPVIPFPSGVDVVWDMWVKVGIDEGTFPDCDFVYVEVHYFDGEAWTGWISVSNPTHDPDIPNYVFTGSVDEWTPFSQGWPGYNDMSILDGLADSIQFRVGLHSNDDPPTTFGFHIDNFEVLSSLDVDPPTDLTAEYNMTTGFVDLNWNQPTGMGGPMQWDDGSFESSIYFSTGSGYLGEEFPVGGACTILEFTVFGLFHAGPTTMGIYEKSGTTYSPTPTYTMNIVTQEGTPATYTVNWDVEDDFIVAFECSQTIDCALDENTVPSVHSYVLSGGWITWQEVAAANQLPDGEWGIRCTTTYPQVTPPNSYNVYRSLSSGEYDDPIDNVTDTLYTDETVEAGNTYYYVVTALYDEGESGYSNEVPVFVESATAVEYAYDDGTAEESYSAGAPANCLAVRITPDTYPVKLIRIKYYITTINQQVIVQAWDDDGPDGEPGTQLVDPLLIVPTSALVANDWNVVTLQDAIYDITFEDGDFYIGWFEASNSSLIGVDTNGPCYNRSWQYTGGTWFDHNAGIPQNIMMRAVVDTAIVGVDDDIPQSDNYLLQNYPNPIKSSTTFKYNLKGNNKNVEIHIYNILGQKIDTVTGENGKADWTPGDIPNGIYFYKLKTDNFTETKRMLLLR